MYIAIGSRYTNQITTNKARRWYAPYHKQDSNYVVNLAPK